MTGDTATAGANGLAGAAGATGAAGAAGLAGTSLIVLDRALADLGAGWTADPADEVIGAIGGGMDADSDGIPTSIDRWLEHISETRSPGR